MNRFGKNRGHNLPSKLCVAFLFFYVIIFNFETFAMQSDRAELLGLLLAIRLPGAQLTRWDDIDNILHFNHNDRSGRIHVYGPLEYDLNGDEKNEIVVGYKFIDIAEEDSLGIYRAKEDEQIERVFSKRFERIDMGEFTLFELKDVTGDGMLKLMVRYNFASAGANAAGWEEFLYIIRGRSPFDTLLELKVREGWVSNEEESRFIVESEIRIEDVNDDTINEIIVTQYKGKDEDSLREITLKPSIYHLIGGRYQVKQ